WDVWDISDRAAPTFRVREALHNGDEGEDWTATFMPEYADYPWTYPDGRAFIPFVCYHSQWSGRYWNMSARRAMYHGTLTAIALSTFTQHCAHSASGSTVIAAGLLPISSTSVREEDAGKPVRSIVL